jgi:arsenate reductase
MSERLRILFLCTGNSCRSQMAEGFARQLRGDAIDAYSAGTDPHGMNRLAIAAMSEAGVNISRGHSKHVDELKDVRFDYVVTVCDHAHETCPMFPGKTKIVHVGFEDPPKLARDANAKTDAEALPHYRRVRDQIKAWVQTLPQSLPSRT